MIIYVVRRVGILVGTLLLASAVIFAVLNVLPGSAAHAILGSEATDESVAALEAQLGLDQPALMRYVEWIGGLIRGDMGVSYISGFSVAASAERALAVTAPLAVLALLGTIIIGVPLGILAGAYHGRLADHLISALTQLGIAVPAFWAGLMFVTFFAVRLGWLPSGGYVPFGESPIDWLRSLILPVLALALAQGAVLTRYVRSSILETMRSDYIRTARAKGLTRLGALWRHGLQNASIPLVTVLGLELAALIGGTIVVEAVFFLPGLGSLILSSVLARDVIVVQSIVMLIAATILIVNFLVDISYRLLDPRLRHGARA
ncbi:ABC transporter permease [Diaminobutyricimonas sp. LJ205]|uniref:ABC transporter permease n=1 Tax=Diaminobutyricimonas sp. LJ205 TaxID=2683590 RepID=UPI0012F5014F|nr:ABC transporter permease [Diaminobutyricimonas sp. LJ205]